MRKKTLLFLMAVLLSLPARLSAFEYTYEGVTLNYEVINEEAKTCKVSGYKDFSGALVIPDVANDGTTDYTVTSIGKNAFFESKGLTSVVIPNSVTSIGAYAFYVCRGLTSVVIGNSVETIGEGAFYCCTGLTSVVIPNSVQKIDEIAFGGCGLKKSAFPNTLKNPFENGWGTVIAYNPEGAIIEDGWIWGPNKSAIYFVPLSLEGEYTIPESVTSIGNGAFAYCSDLTSVVIPNLVTSIGDYSFYNCNGLTSVVIPNSVTSIGEMAFNKCSGLKKSAYPNTLSNPFSDGVAVAYTSEGAIIEDGWIWGPNKSAIYFAPLSFEGEYSIPESVASIGKNAFYGCSGLTSVVIPNSVQTIGAYAFYKCSGLTSVVIPNLVTSIGKYAFYGCTGLTSVVISNSVTSIGEMAFNKCSGLKKSAYPNTLENPFPYGICVAYNPEGAIIEDGWVWGPNKEAIYFVPLTLEGEFSIPESVTSIGGNAFEGCSGLTSVVIPESVTSIGNLAFSETGLLSLTFNAEECNYCGDEFVRVLPSSIENLVIGDKVKTIPDYIFKDLKKLTSLVIPNSVRTIGNDAFNGCSGLTSVVIPNSVQTIGKNAFYGCSGLTSVVIPNLVTSIGEMAFNKCSGLKKSAYPNTLENPFPNGICVAYNPEGAIIEDGWVWGPNKEAIYFVPLTLEGEFSIPESVTSIGGNAFEGCSGLTSVTALPESPAVMNVNSFEGLYDKVKLTVPDVAVNNYLATNWSLFKNIQNNSGLELGTFSDGVFEYRLNPTDMTAMVIGAKDYSTLQIPERFTDDTDGTNPVRYYIKGIGYKAFDGKGVNSVEFNSRTQMEYIGDYAFANTKISSITLPETMKNIGDYAFYKASNLSEVELKEGVSAIGSHAFAETNLSSISIPESVATIGDYAFYKTSNLSEVELKEGVSAIGSHAFAETNLSSISIPESVATIGDYAFYKASNLSEVELKEGVSAIGGHAFAETNLSSISIPESVATIGDYAFYNTKNLSKVELKDGLFSIGENAFGANGKRSGRESFYMPSTVETVGLNAFNGFTCIHVDISDLNAWCRIDFGNETANPLGGSEGLYIDGDEVTKLDIPENIREIKPYAFAGFNSMESLVISNGVELLGDYSFANCLNLREITVGNNVQLIGLTVFDKCFNVNSLVLSDAKSSIEIHDSSILTWLNNVTYLYMGRKINITR